ncbi:MAG: HAMP domain-containing protein, partial [Alphaproteobacteria bacterium]|nr:HAMP domain-containing protein [Alphaproteobacteria bacterium]
MSRPSQLAFAVAVLALMSVIVTYLLVTRTSNNLSSASLIILGAINLLLMLVLAGLICWRVARLLAARRSGGAGARLHFRLVTWFSAIAIVPAIIVAVFASVTLNVGMQAWFSANVSTALDGSVNIARQYVQEQRDRIVVDMVEIAGGIQNDRSLRDASNNINQTQLYKKLELMTRDRGLVGSFIVNSAGVLRGSSSRLPYSQELAPSAADLADARHGHPVVGADEKTGRLWALVHLDTFNDAYLLIVRLVDPAAFTYYQRNKGAVTEYHALEQNRRTLQLIFALLYGLWTLMVLLAAIWSGLWAANRLVRPISDLVEASEKVSSGDLSAQVRVARDDDELGTLGLAFNRMTQQLSAQRQDLVAANRINEARRRFTETVLSGVSAGVVGIGHDGILTIV